MREANAEMIKAASPKETRPFVRVTCDIEPHKGFPQLCKAIGVAFERFQDVPFRWKEIDLIIADELHRTIQSRFGYKTFFMPLDRFPELVDFLKMRIDRTIQGKRNASQRTPKLPFLR